MGATHILVVFGGLANFSGDDISKFLWMIRIAAGVFPQIKEQNYYSNGRYKIDKDVSPGMKNCLMYRLVYYRFSEMANRRAQSQKEMMGWDSVRKTQVGDKDIKLKYFQEAYTTDHWLLRIYKVLPEAEMDDSMKGRPLSNTIEIPKINKVDRPAF